MKILVCVVSALILVSVAIGAFASNLTITNHTPYILNVYIDNVAVGQVAPTSEASMPLADGPHNLYATAVGTNETWGPFPFTMNYRGLTMGIWDQSQISIMPVDLTIYNASGKVVTVNIDGAYFCELQPGESYVHGVSRGVHTIYCTTPGGNETWAAQLDVEGAFTETINP